MPGLGKKGCELASPKLAAYLDDLSKSCLVDIVADFIMREIGEQATDAELILAAFEAAEPVAVVRNDRLVPPLDWAKKGAERGKDFLRKYPGNWQSEERVRAAKSYGSLAAAIEALIVKKAKA